jgi:hypothetical protein
MNTIKHNFIKYFDDIMYMSDDINEIMKKTITTNMDLEILTRALGLKVWIGMRDEMNVDVMKSFNYFILNIQDSTKRGLHWVGLFRKPFNNNNYLTYFDSYGSSAVKEVCDSAKRMKAHLMYSNGIYQTLTSQNCGFFAVAFLLAMAKQVSFKKFSSWFSTDEKKNDAIVKRIIIRELVKLKQM